MDDRNKSLKPMTFWDHLEVLLRWRKTVIVVMLLVIVGSLAGALSMKLWYRSETRILPPPANSFGLSGLLPSLNLGSLGAGSLMGNETTLPMTILDSRKLKDAVIDKFDWMKRHKLKNRKKAYSVFEDIVEWEIDANGSIVIYVTELSPEIAYETANYIVDFLKDEYTIVTAAQARNQREFIGRRVDQAYRDIDTLETNLREYQDRTGVISLEDQVAATVDAVALLYGKLALAEVQYKVASSTLPEDAAEVQMAKRTVAALREEVQRASYSSEEEAKSYLVDLNIAPDAAIEFYRMEREMELQKVILEFLLPQYEQARIMELREEANLYVLDSPNIPDKKHKPKRAFVVLGYTLIGFILLYSYIAFVEWLRRTKSTDPHRHKQLLWILHVLQPGKFFGKSDPPEYEDEQ